MISLMWPQWTPDAELPDDGSNVTVFGTIGGDNNPLTIPSDIPSRWLHTTNVPVDQTQGTASAASSIYLGDSSELALGIRSAT